MALGVLFMLALGVSLSSSEGAVKDALLEIHESTGILLLVTVIGRIGWHFYSRRPRLPRSASLCAEIAARVVHRALYALMLAMPLTGWIMTSALGKPVVFFALVSLPHLMGKNTLVALDLRDAHATLGYILIALVGVHLAAGLGHHFVSRDDVLLRMMPKCLSGVLNQLRTKFTGPTREICRYTLESDVKNLMELSESKEGPTSRRLSRYRES